MQYRWPPSVDGTVIKDVAEVAVGPVERTSVRLIPCEVSVFV
jgi:hypothetical protein